MGSHDESEALRPLPKDHAALWMRSGICMLVFGSIVNVARSQPTKRWVLALKILMGTSSIHGPMVKEVVLDEAGKGRRPPPPSYLSGSKGAQLCG